MNISAVRLMAASRPAVRFGNTDRQQEAKALLQNVKTQLATAGSSQAQAEVSCNYVEIPDNGVQQFVLYASYRKGFYDIRSAVMQALDTLSQNPASGVVKQDDEVFTFNGVDVEFPYPLHG